jgi:hypothetical protein
VTWRRYRFAPRAARVHSDCDCSASLDRFSGGKASLRGGLRHAPFKRARARSIDQAGLVTAQQAHEPSEQPSERARHRRGRDGRAAREPKNLLTRGLRGNRALASCACCWRFGGGPTQRARESSRLTACAAAHAMFLQPLVAQARESPGSPSLTGGSVNPSAHGAQLEGGSHRAWRNAPTQTASGSD